MKRKRKTMKKRVNGNIYYINMETETEYKNYIPVVILKEKTENNDFILVTQIFKRKKKRK